MFIFLKMLRQVDSNCIIKRVAVSCTDRPNLLFILLAYSDLVQKNHILPNGLGSSWFFDEACELAFKSSFTELLIVTYLFFLSHSWFLHSRRMDLIKPYQVHAESLPEIKRKNIFQLVITKITSQNLITSVQQTHFSNYLHLMKQKGCYCILSNVSFSSKIDATDHGIPIRILSYGGYSLSTVLLDCSTGCYLFFDTSLRKMF